MRSILISPPGTRPSGRLSSLVVSALRLGLNVSHDRLKFIVPTLDLDLRRIGHVAAGQFRRRNIDGEHVVAAVHVKRTFFTRFFRAVPAAVMDHHGIRKDTIGDNHAGKDRTAAARDLSHITRLQAELLGGIRMNPHRFAIFDVRKQVRSGTVELRMQTIAALARQ